MPTSTSPIPSLDDTRAALARVGQDHLLRFVHELSPAQVRALCAQVATLPLHEIPRLIDRYVKSRPTLDAGASGAIEPATLHAPDAALASRGGDLIRAGKVAAFTVAGGQGTRLGYDGPKGCYPAGAVTKKPLFHMLADSILAAQRRFDAAIPWAIMTSPLNHDATVAFFAEHDHFGLDPALVMFFPQGVMPSFDMATGRLLLNEKHEVATNPDGHGGSFRALRASRTLDRLRDLGVEHLSYCQIDNPIVRVIDPVFLGMHVGSPHSSGEMSSKAVVKTELGEKVGVFAQRDGRACILEYSDLPPGVAETRDAHGQLRYRAANIAVHVLSLDFIDRLTSREGDTQGASLPFHRAEKKVPFVDLDTGERVEPDTPNAVKLELFAFDALPLCARSLVMETSRVEEFAPIKNASGVDSPESSARLQTERAARWLEAAGVKVPRRADGSPDCTLEISARTATTAEELRSAPNLPLSIRPGEALAL